MEHNNINSKQGYHQSVLRYEAVEMLEVDPSGVYVDATFGGGGHSREILKKLGKEGRLIGFDQDADAKRNVPDDEKFELINENFRYLQRFLRVQDAVPVSGVLADLGVSSYQFDTAERGFSIRMDAPLDMRMDRRQELTAAEVLRTYSEEQLWRLFENYGEVRNARRLASHLVKMRKQFPLQTIGELKSILLPLVKGKERRYLAQVFQALRIEVNDEMGALKELLIQSERVLKPGGRLVVITFHSLEDRLVKRFMKEGGFEEQGSSKNLNNRLKPVFKKPIVPSVEERESNPRATSAKMRVAEKIVEE